MDSISYAFRPRKEAAIQALMRNPHYPAGYGGVLFKDRGPGGARIGAFPEKSLVWIEGRLDALLTADADSHGLPHHRELEAGADVAERWTAAMAAGNAPGGCEVRRLDLAAELQGHERYEGIELLRQLGRLDAPHTKTVTWGRHGITETVYWVALRSRVVKLRAYDKGVESGTHAAGERIRVELQHRPAKGKRKRPATLAEEDLRDLYMTKLDGWRVGRPTVLGDADAVCIALMERVRRGEMTHRKARELVGGFVCLRVDAYDGTMSKRQRAYARRELRRAGVLAWDGNDDRAAIPTVTIDVPAALNTLREGFAA